VKIRRRLALFSAAVTAAAMIVFGVLIGALGAASAPSDQEKSLQAAATEAVTAYGATHPGDLAGQPLPPILVDIATSTDMYLAVYEDDGTPIYATGRIDGAVPALPAAVTVEALASGASDATVPLTSKIEVRLHAVRWSQGGQDAVLVAGQSTAFVDEQLAGLSAVIWVSGIIALIAATFVGWLVSGRALRPLRRLVATTDQIGITGDLSQRLPHVTTDDEVGALTKSFNGMLDSVESAQDQLGEALAAQRRFVADASHELRSPLTTIRSNAGFLRDRPDVDPRDREDAIEDIAAEADRMSRLVDDLLALASEDAGRRTRKVPVDLGEIVEELLRRAARLDAIVTVDVERRVMVLGDPAALSRMAWILIENAAIHGARTVDVTMQPEAGAAVLVVADDGPGFPPGELDRVFERFHRGDQARSPAGSGLGLAIAKAITLDHGGSIDAANRPARGAVVTATIPLAPR